MPDVQRPSLTEIATVLAEQQPATFCLYRHEDVTGVSGPGVVAFGTRYADGTVVLRWCGESPSTVVWPSLEAAERVHGHGGRTEIVWLHDPATDVDADDPLVREIHTLFAGDMPPELVDEITRRMSAARDLQQRLTAVAGAPDAVRTAQEFLTRGLHQKVCGCADWPNECVAAHAPETLGDYIDYDLHRLAAAGLLRPAPVIEALETALAKGTGLLYAKFVDYFEEPLNRDSAASAADAAASAVYWFLRQWGERLKVQGS